MLRYRYFKKKIDSGLPMRNLRGGVAVLQTQQKVAHLFTYAKRSSLVC